MATTLQDVIDQMAECGIRGISASDLVVDGKYHRFRPEGGKTRKKSAWYILHAYQARSGKSFYAGAFGRGPDKWAVQSSQSGLSVEDRAAFQREQEARRRQAEKERRAAAETAAGRAARFWERASDAGRSPYLEHKGVGTYGLRFRPDGTALVPMRDVDGKLHGVQFLSPDGEKLFNRDVEKTGKFHLIGQIHPDRPLLFAEGYATCARIHEATNRPVVVCFDAGNIDAVASALRKLYPNTPFVFCGDDDRHLRRRLRERLEKLGVPGNIEPDGTVHVFHVEGSPLRVNALWRDSGTGRGRNALHAIQLTIERGKDAREYLLENAGRKAAMGCARKYGGIAVFPAFAAKDADGTDFDDQARAEGLGVVRERIEQAIAGVNPDTRDEAPPGGEDGGLLRKLLKHAVMVYDAKVSIWDGLHRQVVSPDAFKMVYGEVADDWRDHPKRRLITGAQLVFDPTDKASAKDTVNMFEGLPLEPDINKPYQRFVDLLCHLCGEDAGLFDWVTKWLAYPLQHPGAKMRTSLIFHGRLEGTGKSLFFEVMRNIYGRYSSVVTQHQLNSAYTGWLSNKLFILAEEVLTQQDKKLQKGYLKHIVANPELQIDEKFLPLRTEKNHCNFVFLSNEIQPLALDEFDRRYTVSYCDQVIPLEEFKRLGEDLKNGAAEGLMAWLMSIDLGDFTEHTRPFENEARRRLITLGMSPIRRFLELWQHEMLDVPFCSCSANDLYQAFRAYCRISGERFITTQTEFGTFMAAEFAAKHGMRKKLERCHLYEAPDEKEPVKKQLTVYLVPRESGAGARTLEAAKEFLDNDVQAFQRAMWSMASSARRIVQ